MADFFIFSSLHQACLDEAGALFNRWIENRTYVPPNLRTLVYRYGMATQGNPSTWNTVLDRYLKENNAQEKKKLLFGLSQVRIYLPASDWTDLDQ